MSDAWSLQQHQLLSCVEPNVESNSFVPPLSQCSAGPGVCRDPHTCNNTASMRSSEKKTEFPRKVKMRKQCVLSQLLLNPVLEVVARVITKKMKNESHTNRKKPNYPCLPMTCSYIEVPEYLYHKILGCDERFQQSSRSQNQETNCTNFSVCQQQEGNQKVTSSITAAKVT